MTIAGTPPSPPECRGRLRHRVAFVVLGGIALAFLVLEHRVHLLGALPYLAVLVCPLLHLFHHGGGHAHGGRQEHHARPTPSTERQP